jgi:hypothetical protein
MRRIPIYACEAPGRFSRLFAVITIFAAGISVAPEEVRGQTPTCREAVADMVAQQKMIGILRSLDYQIREHFLLEANAILSTYGGWNSIERGNDATNATKFRDSTDTFLEQVAGIKRDIGRNSAIGRDELQRFNSSLDDFLVLIETGDQIAKAIDAGKVNEANQIYFESARPKYLQVHGDLYTLITTAERRVASLAGAPCN